jgi:hypothetical protein
MSAAGDSEALLASMRFAKCRKILEAGLSATVVRGDHITA